MVEDHRHCVVCGKSVPPEKFFCSPSCEEMFKLQQRRLRRTRVFTMLFFVIIFVLVIFLSALRGPS
jgi:predicted nucleic acid-binding Zn ribbon protein